MLGNLPNLPKSVLGFYTEMEPYFSNMTIKDGKVILQVKDEIWQSADAYCKFIRYVKEQEAKFHISTYTNPVYDTEPMGWYGELKGISLQVDVKTMLLDRLTCFFTPETEFSIADSLSFLLLQGGLSSGELQRVLNIPKSTFSRYRNICSKTEQPQKTENAPIPSMEPS